MNGTTALYTPAQLAVLPLAGALMSPLLSWFFYWAARRRHQAGDTLKSRAYLFYRMLSGILLGQFIGHTIWTHSYALVIFVALGYFLFDGAEGVARIWNTNTNWVGPADYDAPDDVGLNRQTMEVESIVVSDDLSGRAFQDDQFTAQADYKDTRKRQWMLVSIIVLFIIISTMDGIQLVALAPPTAAIITCYYINAAALSVAVYGAMIHAKFHVTEEDRPRLAWWVGVTVGWCVVFTLCSSLMALVGLQLSEARAMIQSEALIAFYGASSGALLKVQQYFHTMKMSTIDRRDTWLGIGVFGVALAQSMVTSIYL